MKACKQTSNSRTLAFQSRMAKKLWELQGLGLKKWFEEKKDDKVHTQAIKKLNTTIVERIMKGWEDVDEFTVWWSAF